MRTELTSRRKTLMSAASVPALLLAARAAAAAGALAVGGCNLFTVSNGKITVSTSELLDYAQAGANLATLVGPLLGPAGATISALSATFVTAAGSISTASNGSVTLTFDSSSVPAAVSSLFSDGKTLITDISGVLGATVSTEVLGYVTAFQTLWDSFSALIGVSGASLIEPVPTASAKRAAFVTLRVVPRS